MKQNPSIAYNHYMRYKRKYAKLVLDKATSIGKLAFLRKRILQLKEFLDAILLRRKLMKAVGAFGLVFSTQTTSAQVFAAPTTNPFGLTTTSNFSRPVLVDINNDGDLDLFSGQDAGDFNYFQNTGSASVPAFFAVVLNPFGLTDIGDKSRPAFADLDNDGDLDLLSGEFSGDFKYFQNTGSVSSPTFAAAVTNPFGLTNPGYKTNPTFVDFDNDGDIDIMSGGEGGNFHYYQNTGSVSAPVFAAPVTDSFGLSDVGGHSTPTFVDIDFDGDMDLMSGEEYGNIKYFQNTGSASAAAFAVVVTNPFSLVSSGFHSAPTFGDLDDDGDMDLMSAESYGSFRYFQNTCASAALIKPTAVVGTFTVCSGSSNSYSIAPVAGATTYDWKNPIGWTGSSITNTIALTCNASGGVVKVTAKNSCRSRSISKALAVITSPTINAVNSPTLICVGETSTLTPSGGVSYTWTPAIPLSGIISPTTNTTYTVTGSGSNGCTNTKVITQEVSLCTGIATINGNETIIQLYPNPTSGLVYFELNEAADITMTNSIGEIVLTEKLQSGKQYLNVNNQASGIYFVHVIANGKQQTLKLVKD